MCELSWNEIGISGLKTRKEDVSCIAGKKKLSDEMYSSACVVNTTIERIISGRWLEDNNSRLRLIGGQQHAATKMNKKGKMHMKNDFFNGQIWTFGTLLSPAFS